MKSTLFAAAIAALPAVPASAAPKPANPTETIDFGAELPSRETREIAQWVVRASAHKGRGRSTVWLDYDAGIAMHKVPARKTSQRRAERIVSARAADHRITYGCINVPAAFYDSVISLAFKPEGGIVHVLPERMPLEAVFKSYGVGERAGVAAN